MTTCINFIVMFCSQLSHEKEEAERRELQKMLMGGDDGKDKGDKSSKSKKDDDSGPAVRDKSSLLEIRKLQL